MANETMTLISTATVGSGGASNIDFTSIPQTYTDLVVFSSLRDTNAVVASAGARLIFNGSGTGYSRRALTGDGSTATSELETSASWIRYGQHPGSSATANTFSNDFVYIPNYTAAVNKTASADAVGENNGTTARQVITAGLWANTAAITSLTIQSNSTAFAQYSSASLYGILKGSGGASVS